MRAFAEWLQASPLSTWIQTTTWVIPLVQSIHILTIGIVFGSILMVSLRVLGMIRSDETPAVVVARFSPWIGYGVIVMAVTGVILIIGEPIREFSSTSFWLKMALVAVAVASAAFFRGVLVQAAPSGFSTTAKSTAAATIALWLFIIFLGRAIAYDIEVWGPLSLAHGA
jgi:uncharacterized membrane protein SirB2